MTIEQGLAAKTGALADAVGSMNEKLDVLNTKIRHSRKMMVVLAVSVALDVLLSVGLFFAVVRTNDISNGIITSRTEARINQCQQDNVSRIAVRDAVISGVIVAFPSDPNRTAAAQARIDVIINNYTATVTDKLPLRDCSSEGIKQYYSPN